MPPSVKLGSARTILWNPSKLVKNFDEFMTHLFLVSLRRTSVLLKEQFSV